MSRRTWQRAALVGAAGVLLAHALRAHPDPPRGPADTVDESPVALPDNPTPHYPIVHYLGMKGTVVVQATIDTSGHVVRESVGLLYSTDDRLAQPVLDVVPLLRFGPARSHGRRVRVRMELTFAYPPPPGAEPRVWPAHVVPEPPPLPRGPGFPWVLPGR